MLLHYFEQFYSVLGSKVLPGEGRLGLGSKVLPGEGRWGLGSKVLPGEGRFFTVNLFKILHYFEQFYSVLGSKMLPG